MDMRLPESGSVVASMLGGLGHAAADGYGLTIGAVTEDQLVEAIAAMARGEIEFVILEDGAAFVQAAGEGDGPYALQCRPPSGDELLEVPGGVDTAAMRAALLAYRRGDGHWRGQHRWSPL